MITAFVDVLFWTGVVLFVASLLWFLVWSIWEEVERAHGFSYDPRCTCAHRMSDHRTIHGWYGIEGYKCSHESCPCENFELH